MTVSQLRLMYLHLCVASASRKPNGNKNDPDRGAQRFQSWIQASCQFHNQQCQPNKAKNNHRRLQPHSDPAQQRAFLLSAVRCLIEGSVGIRITSSLTHKRERNKLHRSAHRLLEQSSCLETKRHSTHQTCLGRHGKPTTLFGVVAAFYFRPAGATSPSAILQGRMFVQRRCDYPPCRNKRRYDRARPNHFADQPPLEKQRWRRSRSSPPGNSGSSTGDLARYRMTCGRFSESTSAPAEYRSLGPSSADRSVSHSQTP